MNFAGSPASRPVRLTPSRGQRFRRSRASAAPANLGCAITFYDRVPSWVTLDLLSFETVAVERIRVLKIVESHKQARLLPEEMRHKVEKELRDSADLNRYALAGKKAKFQHISLRLPATSMAEDSVLQVVQSNRERDLISHFILRLAFSRTDDLRRWFIAQEVDLFRLRCQGLSSDELHALIEQNELNFDECDDQERTELGDELRKSSGLDSANVKWFKVPFTEALELVRLRKVFIKRGLCFVPESEMVLLLTSLFRTVLTHALAHTSKFLPVANVDARLRDLLMSLDQNDTSTMLDDQWQQRGNLVHPEQIPQLANEHFPLCMRAMQKALETHHHLKYKGRLQYGLFLKAIGLSLEDAVKFFRIEFGKGGVDSDKFDKQYLYNIRYNYGQEGKKVNWSAWNCNRIIRETVSTGDCHGCPYRHVDLPNLKTMLAVDIDDPTKIEEILDTVKEKHYQKACGMQFAATHKGRELSTGLITSHPNQYYAESREGNLSVGNVRKSHNVKTERGVVFAKKEECEDKEMDIDDSILEQMEADTFDDEF